MAKRRCRNNTISITLVLLTLLVLAKYLENHSFVVVEKEDDIVHSTDPTAPHHSFMKQFFRFFYENNTCAPDLEPQVPSLPAMARSDRKFYIDDRFNDNKLIKLLSRKNDFTTGVDHMFNAYQSEHTSDFYFNRLLRRHPNRVFRIEEASIIFLNTSFPTKFLFFKKDHKSHMYKVLSQVEYLLNTTENTRIAFLTSNFQPQRRFMKILREIIAEHPKRFIVGIKDMSDALFHNDVITPIVPYKANKYLELHEVVEKSKILFFAGNCRRNNEGKLRKKVLSKLNGNFTCRKYRKIKDQARMALEYAHNILESNFCLSMAGDSASARRLFDTMAGGCIPVHCGTYDGHNKEYSMKYSLPFPHQIDWRNLLLFAGGMECLHKTMSTALLNEKIETLLHYEQLKTAQEAVRRTFRTHLSYLSPRLVDAFLNEVTALEKEKS